MLLIFSAAHSVEEFKEKRAVFSATPAEAIFYAGGAASVAGGSYSSYQYWHNKDDQSEVRHYPPMALSIAIATILIKIPQYKSMNSKRRFIGSALEDIIAPSLIGLGIDFGVECLIDSENTQVGVVGALASSAAAAVMFLAGDILHNK